MLKRLRQFRSTGRPSLVELAISMADTTYRYNSFYKIGLLNYSLIMR
jgi:hypothetical protein